MNIDTARWRALADLDPRPVSKSLRDAADVVDRIRYRIDRAFAEDADKYEADKHAALEDIEKILNGGQ